MTEHEKYRWAVRYQGYEGTFADWQAMSADEREEYDDGAAGVGTV